MLAGAHGLPHCRSWSLIYYPMQRLTGWRGLDEAVRAGHVFPCEWPTSHVSGLLPMHEHDGGEARAWH
jgi:hypothetical protein